MGTIEGEDIGGGTLLIGHIFLRHAGRDDLARRSAAKLDELALAPEVLLHFWIRGFGVRLDEP
jgi:hypothetical protein